MDNWRKFWGLIVRFWQKNTGDWQIHRESSVPKPELTKSFEQNSIPSFAFYFLLTLATLIATLGLLSDSTATIIGAMIIAPLMNPILSLAYGIVINNNLLIRRSALTLFTGICLTILVAYLITGGIDITIARKEIIARGNPNLLDLGVAMASGAAAAFAYTRKSVNNALSGVAIAVALVPPLSVVGIGLSLGNKLSLDLGLSLPDKNLAVGAFLLFLTNLVGIIFCAVIIFISQGYGSFFSALKELVIALIALFIISLPLDISLREILLEAQVRQGLNTLISNRPQVFQQAVIRSIDVNLINSQTSNKKVIHIEIGMFAPNGTINNSNFIIAQNFLSRYFNQPVKLKIKVANYNIYE